MLLFLFSQNEKTMDALQSDISDLEEENSDLKKKLETYAKKTNLDLARLSQSSSAMAGIVCKNDVIFLS